MYMLVVWLPLVSAIVSGLFGRRVGVHGAGWLSSGCIGLGWLVSSLVYYETVVCGATTYIKLWSWVEFEWITVEMGVSIDSLGGIVVMMVMYISLWVHIYSIGYMEGDPHIPRYMSYLSLFTCMMVVLVVSENYLQLFIGWEGVGLCSYLLVNYWITRINANKSAVKAMLVNRVGDMGLILGMIVIVCELGVLDFSTIAGVVGEMGGNVTVMGMLLLAGAIGKSAQLGLHSWLPDAMEGPTPVSALIHAATMVTAGVYLLMRSAVLLECSSLVLMVVVVVGGVTALFGATVSVVQNDIKRIIAYSTCSQLGYMVMGIGLCSHSVGLYHMVNHACFKSLLFLGAGSVIHSLQDEQDVRRMGGLASRIPFTYVIMVVGSMSLMGFPYLSGYYSKDMILELGYGSYIAAYGYWLGSITVMLTGYYAVKVVSGGFIVDSVLARRGYKLTEECGIWMYGVLLVLGLSSIFVGYGVKDIVVWDIRGPVLGCSVKWGPVVLSGVGGVLGHMVYSGCNVRWIRVYEYSGGWCRWYYRWYSYLYSGWQYNSIVNNVIVRPGLWLGYMVMYKAIDRGLLEWVGPRGISSVLVKWTRVMSGVQSGLVFNYVLVVVGYLVVLIVGYKWV